MKGMIMASIKALKELVELDSINAIIYASELPEYEVIYDYLGDRDDGEFNIMSDFDDVEDLKTFILLVIEDLEYNSVCGKVNRFVNNVVDVIFKKYLVKQ
jgi:hypothetical protein